jgi:hypothetical protein
MMFVSNGNSKYMGLTPPECSHRAAEFPYKNMTDAFSLIYVGRVI